MNRINTVTGTISAEQLGLTLMHEHLIIDFERSPRGGMIGRIEDVPRAIEELQYFKSAGGLTLVEMTTGDVGRDVRALREISRMTGINIVASTGYYTEPTYRREVNERNANQLAALMIEEIEVGIDGTDIKAGIIGEIGTHRRHITAAEERVFRAAGKAQRATGLAVSTHTYWGGELAFDQVELLTDEGVPPDRIVIGHLGDTREVEYYAELGRLGVYLQFDHIGKQEYLPDYDRAVMIRDMVELGFVDQLLISSDICYRTELRSFGGIGYDHVINQFMPLLQKVGIAEEIIDRIVIDNPSRVLPRGNSEVA